MSTLERLPVVTAVPYRHPAGGGSLECRGCGTSLDRDGDTWLARIAGSGIHEYVLLLCTECAQSGSRWRR